MRASAVRLYAATDNMVKVGHLAKGGWNNSGRHD